MKNIQYVINDKYVVISQNVIQSRKYKVNKITIGTLVGDTGKTLKFQTDNGFKRINKRTIAKLINISAIMNVNTQFFIERIEGALV